MMLKWIALFAMLADHAAKILSVDSELLLWAGRLAMPLFGYLVARGCYLTMNPGRYAGRLALMGLIAQPLYMLAFNTPWYYLNVGFTLALAVLLIQYMESKNWRGVVLVLLASIFTEYAVMGPVFILACYYLIDVIDLQKDEHYWPALAAVLVTLGYLNDIGWLPVTMLALILILVASLPGYEWIKSRANGNPLLFYAFYPVHLLLLICVRAA